MIYYLIDRLVHLKLTPPILTTVTERAFSTMNITKTRFHNKLEDFFLVNYLVIYGERKKEKEKEKKNQENVLKFVREIEKEVIVSEHKI